MYRYSPLLNNHYDITGPVEYSFSEYKILPRDANDVTTATGLNSLSNAANWSLYPNPCNGNFIIVSDKSGKGEVRMFDVLGKMVYYKRYENISGSISMNMSHLPKGIYRVQLQTAEGINTKKLIIE